VTSPLTLTVLGSGTAVPSFERFPAGYLVQGAGHSLLVDCGPGVLRRLAQVGVGPDALDAVYLTHFHPDHCADVAALLFALRNRAYRYRRPLRVCAAVGLGEWLEHLYAAWPWLRPRADEYPLLLQELEPGEHHCGPFRIGTYPVVHTAQSLAYRVRLADEPGTVALSGDADAGLGLVEAARDADLFVCDAAFPDHAYEPGHLTPSRAGRVAAEARARHLCLTHFYPECAGHDLASQAATTFAGAVSLAADLRTFTVN
jgi:ribonuclease BN (tRNA processing enzyme)